MLNNALASKSRATRGHDAYTKVGILAQIREAVCPKELTAGSLLAYTLKRSAWSHLCLRWKLQSILHDSDGVVEIL